MLTIGDIKNKLAENLSGLKGKYPIERLAVFGSYARGEATDKSDIDIMVEFNGEMGWNYFDLYFDLQKIFEGKKVDLVAKGGIQPRYWPFVEEDLNYV